MGNSEIDPLQQGINHSILNQRLLRNIGEEAIISMAKIIKDVADQLNIPEAIVVSKIRSLKGQKFTNLKDVERLIYNVLLKNENTWNYFDDFNKERQKIIKKEKPNQVFMPS